MPTSLTILKKFALVVAAAVAPISATTAHADITAPSALFNRQFGRSMAFADLGTANYLAIGSSGEFTPGSVFIYRRNALSNTWTLETELVGTGISSSDRFGEAIAMRAGADGSLLVAVGAPGDNISTGTAFLFRRTVSGSLFSWNLEATLTRSDGTFGDYFGGTIAIAPDLSQVAIAAAFDNPTGCGGMQECGTNPGFGRGVVNVYKKSGSNWTLSAAASAPIRATAFEQIGSGLAYGNTISEPPQLLIGASGATDNGVNFAGRVFVVRELTANTWTLQNTVSGGTIAGVPMGGFGDCIQVSGSLAIVGAPFTDVGGLSAVGRALTLIKSPTNNSWSLQANLLLPAPTFTTANSFFGRSVGVQGDMIVVGTAGSHAFLYRSVPGAVTLTSTESLTHPTSLVPNASDGFGFNVAIGTGTVAAGLTGRDIGGVNNVGAVSLFDAFPGKFMSDDPSASENFGQAVAVGNQRAIIGAPNFDGTATNQGRIEIFERSNGGWFRIFSQTATDPSASAFAGRSVAITDDGLRFAFGAPGAASNAGAVYRGVNSSGTTFSFSKLAFASAIATAQAGESLGASVAMTNQGSTRWIVAGAPGFDSGGVADRGRILIWRNEVMHQAILGQVSQSGTGFGNAVAIESYPDGTVDIVVGAPLENVPVGGTTAIDCGSIHIYRKAPLATTFSFHLTARHGTPVDLGDYGSRLALKKSRLVVGCPARANPPLESAGAVFAWTRSGTGVWSQVAGGIGGSDSNERVGSGVSTDGTNVLVGIPGRPNGAPSDSVGAARLLTVSGSNLVVSQTFTSTDSRRFDDYGVAVALGTATNGPIIIGCATDANGDIGSAGSAYGFLGPGNACASDLDGDFSIGAADLSLLLTSWGLTDEDASGVDINLDGIVDATDLSLMLTGWGTCGE